MSARRPLWDRFWEKVDVGGDCWVWTAAIERGYGKLGVASGRTTYAHRVGYQLLVGPIPDGFDIDHLCRNRACVNPDHLEPVPRAINVRRGIRVAQQKRAASVRTHCGKGHELTEANTAHSAGRRWCRECVRLKGQRQRDPGRRAVIEAEVAELSKVAE